MNKRILNTKCVDTLKDPVSSAQYTYKEYTNNNKKKFTKQIEIKSGDTTHPTHPSMHQILG